MGPVRRIFWDTMLYAYWLEDNPDFGARVHEIHQRMEAQKDVLCSSAYVLGEVLVGPLKKGQISAADEIERYFREELTMLPFPAEAARRFAALRSREGIKSVDALHLATAAAAGVDLFLTNDARLKALHVPGIKFIATLATDLF